MTATTLSRGNGDAKTSVRVEPLTCAIGAELHDVSLGDAARDEVLFAEIKSLLLKYKVLFLENQDITRAEHVAFARRFGALEDHPVVGSDPDHPGLVLIQGTRHPRRAIRERVSLRHDLA
jgi:taurine dioxygenase